ncbi:MAG: hypothetical protein FJ318_10160 [SAR202 cluster bacterium]|nr:hypothetical protein [SAR202 cluster bacterium]
MKATDWLRQDHRAVEGLFRQVDRGSDGEKADTAKRIFETLTTHAQLEEDIFYPAVPEADLAGDLRWRLRWPPEQQEKAMTASGLHADEEAILDFLRARAA